ncbi:MAG: pyrimidine/purine nucleoside phosphorylase [Gammaproteobacteria bacterium]
MARFDNVSVLKKSNVFFDGKCVSHTVMFADGSRKTVGVILPATLTFNVGAPERMEIVAGQCRARIDGGPWQAYGAGESFSVPANGSFDIEATEPVDYVCHFG